MDKNKSRTDLLAAGRKKLQQFRQKKDGKASSSRGKSSKKPSKSEHHESDSDAPSTVAKSSTVTSQVSEGEIEAPADSDPVILKSSESHSMENSLPSKLDVTTVDSSSTMPRTENIGTLVADGAGLQVDEVAGDEEDFDSSIPNSVESTPNVHTEVTRVMPLSTVDNALTEVATTADDATVVLDVSSSPASVSASEEIAINVERDGVNRGDGLELIPSDEDIPDMPKFQAGGDKVTDEVDGLGSNQFDSSVGRELEGDGKLALSDIIGSAETLEEAAMGEAYMEGATGEVKQDRSKESVSAFAGAFTFPEGDETFTVNHQMTYHPGEDTAAGSSLIKNPEILSVSGDSGNDISLEGHKQYFPEGSFISEDKSHEKPLVTRVASLSREATPPGGDGCSISLAQLLDVIRGLDEDEYRLLLMSREPVSHANMGTENIAPSYIPDLLEKLKEELYVSNFMKDICQLQLTDQSELQREFDCQRLQLVDEISDLNVAVSEVHESRACLVEELAHCRSELEAAVCGREELQNQFHTAVEEAEEFSARARELQISLGRSQDDLSNLSLELADCKSQVASLQVDNENLNGSLALLTEERNTLAEQKDKLSMELADCKDLVLSLQMENEKLNATLVLMTEEQKKLVEEKESTLFEHEKLLLELDNCKKLVAGLQVENSSLSGNFGLMTEERNKLQEEKELLAHDNQKVSVELDECKGLLAALQAENSNLNGSLALVTEERKKLEGDKLKFIFETERLSSDLLLLQEQLSKEHGERMLLEVDLKELKVRLEQLMEENTLLNSSLDVHKAKIIEIDSREYQIVEPENQVHSFKFNNELLIQDSGKQDAEDSPTAVGKLSSDGFVGSSLGLREQNVFDDSVGFVALKGHLEEAQNILQDLEKEIKEIYSLSASLNRSSSKLAAPGVSKLIQSFESKVHHDEHEVDESVLIEDQQSADPFKSVRELMGNLRVVLKLLGLDAETASELYRGEKEGRKSANVTFNDLSDQFEALKEHSDNLEAISIELGILYESTKQHACGVEANNNELENLCEALKGQETILRSENAELGERLSKNQSRIGKIQLQFYDIKQTSNEMASVLRNQLERLQKEVADRVLILEQEWKSNVARIVEIVGGLDGCIGQYSSSAMLTGSQAILDTNNKISASVTAAIQVIDDLHEKLEVAYADKEMISSSFKDVNQKFSDLFKRNELALEILHKIYIDLKKLVIDSSVLDNEPVMSMQSEELSDPLDYTKYKTLVEQLETALGEIVLLRSVNNQLNSELMSMKAEGEEQRKQFLDSHAIQRLIDDIKDVVKLEDCEVDLDKTPSSGLESLVYLLVRKYKEYVEQVGCIREEFESKLMESASLQGKLDVLEVQHGIEILALRESLSQTEEALLVARSELQEKICELEQSEQRVSSVREKLSIAVAKGKGLVLQRDNLKQSLAETSSELERCSHELQLKDARLHELETKLKTYSEAGERVEALESELSYIRHSATALRESFLLKDSVLQRIEEILEDLDLSEHFHSRDIIEKVDWLARSAAGNSLPPTDWDQKVSVGGSYSDAGIVATDVWKEDVKSTSNVGEDLRRKYEELQSKFYGLAEQNAMLEQSLMERNRLVQRWEDLLDRIQMPSHVRSMEPDDRIEWLADALFEANGDRDSLQKEVDKLESSFGSLSADLEESRRRTSVLQADLQSVVYERDDLSERLETLTSDHHRLSEIVVQLELENQRMLSEITRLQDKLAKKLENDECLLSIEGEVRRLQGLVSDALLDSGIKDLAADGTGIECLEALLQKLIENYVSLYSANLELGDAVDKHHAEAAPATLDDARSRDALTSEVLAVDSLKKELKEAVEDLMHVKEERDKYAEKQQSMLSEVQALDKKREELQELLNQEEQKSASAREKLNVAVRKGKSLVQQRDNLKQTIEAMNAEMAWLKSEISHRENATAEYEQKIRQLSTYPERVEALESESLLLRNQLTETERLLEEKGHTLNSVLNTLAGIDVGVEINTSDPVEKLERIVKLCHDLHVSLASTGQEARKSKRAAELLLAELNEVQERNDALQEELAKATNEVTEFMKERDVAEAAKLEALSHLETLSTTYFGEKRKRHSELMILQSSLDQLSNGFSDIHHLFSDVFSKDLEFLRNLEANIKSCVEGNDAREEAGIAFYGASGGIISDKSDQKENFLPVDSRSINNQLDHFGNNDTVEACSLVAHHLREFIAEIGTLKEKLNVHSKLLHEQASSLSNLMGMLNRHSSSQKESFEAMKRDIVNAESIGKDKDMEIVTLSRNIALLHEACANAIIEIENKNAELLGNNLSAVDLGMNLKPSNFGDGGLIPSRQTHLFSEEHVKTMADKLLLTVKDFVGMKANIAEVSQKEMKITIASLQIELQEKDIQKDRICSELVGQIKAAEATAASYSRDLESLRTLVHKLEKQVEVMKEERKSLEQKVEELQDMQTTSVELQNKVGSLSNVLAAKDQEIEALMQALDEEEVQMEELTKKIEKLEKVLQQKNVELENLEASHRKVVKKLAITVNKFDELHNLSESLVAEVEKLQSQLQDRDSEISFLRQEVTRCTNDALVASQMSNKRDSDEIYKLLSWLDEMVSGVEVSDVHLDDNKSNHVDEYKEKLQRKMNSIISEVEDLRLVVQSRDALLQMERSKVEELARREETLQKTLREKESQLNMLEEVGDSGRETIRNSEIVEVEPMVNKWAIPAISTASQVRSLRKVNNEQVAIAIDMDPGGDGRLEDEEDDKVHGFKSLTTSRLVPRFTRPITDKIDGLWVSCDRALMRQPALRLGIMIYWAVLHALLATFVF